ncbi:MAG TPA: phosphotransferase, partial [Nocardioides sp.]|nr:phosphotransferase [Nocardioides sp.]
YVDRQMSGWTTRFDNARTDDTGDWSDVIAWLEAHKPRDVGQRMIHNDFRFDNMVLDADDPMRVVGVLDWEMATVGDPLMDLGGTLSYWV